MGRSSEAVSCPPLLIFCEYPCDISRYSAYYVQYCTRYIHKRIYNDDIDVKTSHLCQQLLQNRVLLKLILLLNCSNLVCLNISKRVNQFLLFALKILPSVFLLSYHSVCHSPCHLRSLLSSPDYPLIIIIALSLCSFPHPSAYLLYLWDVVAPWLRR